MIETSQSVDLSEADMKLGRSVTHALKIENKASVLTQDI